LRKTEIRATKTISVNLPTDSIIFENDCIIQGNLNAFEVLALGSLTVNGSVNIQKDIAINRSLTVKEDLLCNLGNIYCKGALRVEGKIISQGFISAVKIDAGDIEIKGDGSIIVAFGISSENRIISGGAIIAGFSVEAKNYIKVGKGNKVFAGLIVSDEKKNAILKEIRTRELIGEIGYGTLKLLKSS